LPTLKGNNSFVVHNFKIKVRNDLCRSAVGTFNVRIKTTPTHVFLSVDGTGMLAGHDLHVVCPKPSWNSPSKHSVQVLTAADEPPNWIYVLF
jgi:hypothetical protein